VFALTDLVKDQPAVARLTLVNHEVVRLTAVRDRIQDTRCDTEVPLDAANSLESMTSSGDRGGGGEYQLDAVT
jgi:hypothetical protein